MPIGPPEWPFKGGYWRQPAWIVDAVDLIRSEWGFRTPAKPTKVPTKKDPLPFKPARRKAR